MDFIQEVERRWGKLNFDLAATAKNAKSKRFYTRKENSLKRSWSPLHFRFWLNPPYRDIDPWVEKCETVGPTLKSNGVILLLVPAAVGSNWFIDHVWGKATVNILSPRLCFVGKNSYPKDLMLCVYQKHRPLPRNMFLFWKWKSQTLINQQGVEYEYKRAKRAE
jgi:phage N-6-adenine-methyltransferase